MMKDLFVLCTYEQIEDEPVWHAYGLTDQATAQAAGARLSKAAHQAGATLTTIVLPLEAMPV